MHHIMFKRLLAEILLLAVGIMEHIRRKDIQPQAHSGKRLEKSTLVKLLHDASKCLLVLGIGLVLLLLLLGTSILLVLLLIVGLLALILPGVIFLALGRFNSKDDLKL